MSIELNRHSFRRLVQLYLLSFVVALGAIVLEMIVWSDFIDSFDRLTIDHFGEPSDLQLFSLGGLGLVGLLAHIVAAIGLLKFKPWSKSLIWTSLLLTIPMAFAPGFYFGWTGASSMWAEMISMALLGAILLLAYSQDHGLQWFVASAGNVEK